MQEKHLKKYNILHDENPKGWVKKEHNNTVKAIYNKPTDNFILNGENWKIFLWDPEQEG